MSLHTLVGTVVTVPKLNGMCILRTGFFMLWSISTLMTKKLKI